jgi:hypothetical protein
MSELTTITVHRLRATAKAVQVSDNGSERDAIWLPLSQIELMQETAKDSGVFEITLPAWLAKKNGLLG